MPDFNTLTGKTAWSDRRNYTSGRVTTGTTERPAAEYRLKDRQIEIRTGARVTRARGPWVGFKRKFTAGGHGLSRFFHSIGLHGVARSQKTINQRLLRHAEYKSDRHVNRLVEDLANGKLTSPAQLDDRLKKLYAHHEVLRQAGWSEEQLAQRFTTNLNESLEVLAQASPGRYRRALATLRGQGGADKGLLGNNKDLLREKLDKLAVSKSLLTESEAMEIARDAAALNEARNDPNAVNRFEAFVSKHSHVFLSPDLDNDYRYLAAKDYIDQALAFEIFDRMANDPDGGYSQHDRAAFHRALGINDDGSMPFPPQGALDEPTKQWMVDKMMAHFIGTPNLDKPFNDQGKPDIKAGPQAFNFSGFERTQLHDQLNAQTSADAKFRLLRKTYRALPDTFFAKDTAPALMKSFLSKAHPHLDFSTEAGAAAFQKMEDTLSEEAAKAYQSPLDIRAQQLTSQAKSTAKDLRAGMDASQDSAAFKALLKEFDIESEHLLYHERQAINRWMDAALIKLGKDTTAEEDAKKTKARMPNSGVDPDRIQLQIGRGQIHQHLKDAINYVTNPEAAAAEFKQDLTEALQEHYGSSVGDTLFAQRGDSASAQGRDLNKGLTFDDREWLTKAARELPEKTNLGSTQRRLQQLNNVLPARLNLTVNANNLHPTAELNGTINAQASGTKAYLDNRVKDATSDPANPGLSDQFLKDVSRMDIRVDNNGNAIRLDKTNSADTLGQFAGNDSNVSLNLSKLMQQGLFNAAHGALAANELKNGTDQPVMPMIKANSQSQAENSLKISASKHGNNYQLRYEWTPNLTGFMTDISSSVPANSRESKIIASTTLTISEDDLRNGNFENYQMTDIDYQIHFELDPVALAYQAAN